MYLGIISSRLCAYLCICDVLYQQIHSHIRIFNTPMMSLMHAFLHRINTLDFISVSYALLFHCVFIFVFVIQYAHCFVTNNFFLLSLRFLFSLGWIISALKIRSFLEFCACLKRLYMCVCAPFYIYVLHAPNLLPREENISEIKRFLCT